MKRIMLWLGTIICLAVALAASANWRTKGTYTHTGPMSISGNLVVGGTSSLGTGTCTATQTIGGTGTQTISIGNGAGIKTVNLGSNTTTSTTNIKAGSGGLNITAAVMALTGTQTTSGATTLGSATATAGLAFGGGASATPLTTAVADKSFGLFYTTTTATSGTSRGLYWKHTLADTTPSGETARFYTVVNAAGADDAHGAHISLGYGASGTCAGESAALRTTLHVPAGALGGTNGSLYTELYADAATSDMSNGQFQRYVLGGDGTGMDVIDSSAALFSIEGVDIGSGATGTKIVRTSTATASHAIRIKVNGTPYYLLAAASP